MARWASPGVIRIDQLVEGLVVTPLTTPSYERRTTSVASDDDSKAAAPGRVESAAIRGASAGPPRRQAWSSS